MSGNVIPKALGRHRFQMTLPALNMTAATYLLCLSIFASFNVIVGLCCFVSLYLPLSKDSSFVGSDTY